MAPFLSGGGYSSEAWSYVTSLRDEKSFRTKIEHHGDMQNFDFWNGLSSETKNLAYHLHSTECGTNETIVICHSEPGAWWPPLFKTNPCPPTGYEDPLYVIGRTMFETDRLNSEHARRCNRMDSVWVPTDFHISTFVNSGVDPSKLLKINQPVDVEFFNSDGHDPLPLPCENPVFGDPSPDSCRGKFVFLSIFKWEKRKGWDLLLKAYLTEFSDKDDVVLYLLTNPYHSDRDFTTQIQRLVDGDLKDSNLGNLAESFHAYPPIQIIDTHIPETDLPGLYKSADAFVLPTRGEGWGRPIVEAMSMSLPVIATNWSGPTEYLTEENGYPLLVERMAEVEEGPFKGHMWAEPSVEDLRILLRRVVSEPAERKLKGMKAREDMIRRFSPEVVAGVVVDQISKILEKKRN